MQIVRTISNHTSLFSNTVVVLDGLFDASLEKKTSFAVLSLFDLLVLAVSYKSDSLKLKTVCSLFILSSTFFKKSYDSEKKINWTYLVAEAFIVSADFSRILSLPQHYKYTVETVRNIAYFTGITFILTSKTLPSNIRKSCYLLAIRMFPEYATGYNNLADALEKARISHFEQRRNGC